MPDKIAYTPAEFAALFGKERTWGYRQIYAGKVNAVTLFGSIMIPAEEVEKAMSGASRYGFSGNRIQRKRCKTTASESNRKSNFAWRKYLKQKRQTQIRRCTNVDDDTCPRFVISLAKGTQSRGMVIKRLRRMRNSM